MQKILLLFFLSWIGIPASGQDKEVKWITFDQLDSVMKVEPRRVIVDIYTDWCGWCKVMDRKTYGDEQVAAYINRHYYAIRFNAEGKSPVTFNGRTFEFKPEINIHSLASELMLGQRSFPCTVIIEKNLMNVVPITGYMKVKELEPVLKYFVDGADRNIPYGEWEQNFKNEWR